MPSKTLGGTSTKPKNTRDYTSDFGPAATQGPGNSKSKPKGAGQYHLRGRPVTRPGNETDQRMFR